MGSNYSRNTFEDFAKIRHYVSVRLKQGVPLVDADINELEDLRRYELRNFLRWFIGDGIPDLNNGFRIMPSGQPNDVIITGGDGTPERSGRCLVDGMEVLNPSDVLFSAQEFADATNAARAGVPVVTLPSTPGAGTRADIYYLDVWEREIGGDEVGHEDIIDPRIGIEAARRIRREWAVRVVDSAVGVPADDPAPDGHRFYPLASVVRTVGQDVIPLPAITDLRRRGVTLQSRASVDQIILDAFGGSYTLDEDGNPNLAMSLRDVINAMLRDGRPAVVGPTVAQTQNGPHNLPTSAVDSQGTQWLFWIGPGNQVFFQQSTSGGWTPPSVAFTASGNLSEHTAAAGTADGAMWFFYSARVGGQWTILGRRFNAGVWEAEVTISTGNNNFSVVATTTASGDALIVWRQGNPPTPQLWSRLFVNGVGQAPVLAANSGAPASEPVPNQIALVADPTGEVRLYALENTGGATWPVRVKTLAGGAWQAYQPVVSIPVNAFADLTAARDRFGATWLIWATQTTPGATVLHGQNIPASGPPGSVLNWVEGVPRFPSAVQDKNNNLQVYYRADDHLERINIIYQV